MHRLHFLSTATSSEQVPPPSQCSPSAERALTCPTRCTRRSSQGAFDTIEHRTAARQNNVESSASHEALVLVLAAVGVELVVGPRAETFHLSVTVGPLKICRQGCSIKQIPISARRPRDWRAIPGLHKRLARRTSNEDSVACALMQPLIPNTIVGELIRHRIRH